MSERAFSGNEIDEVPAEQAGSAALTDEPLPFEIVAPCEQRLPVVLSSPHSGSHYPARFLAMSRLDANALRMSEDCHVDDLLLPAVGLGAPLIRANYPRAFVDLNREAWELDPRMFRDSLPDYVTTRSTRLTAGLGTIARVVASGYEIYDRKLPFAEAARRVEQVHRPYHEALRGLIDATRSRFGYCILIDGHSMPSSRMLGCFDDEPAIDVVLGDCHGVACVPLVTDAAEAALEAAGFGVARNDPYPGGYVTRHYGRPKSGVHALQIEVGRLLYMDERTFEPTAGFAPLAAALAQTVERVADAAKAGLAP